MFVVVFSTHRMASLQKELPVRVAAELNGLKLLGSRCNTEQGLCQWDSTGARGGQGRNLREN